LVPELDTAADRLNPGGRDSRCLIRAERYMNVLIRSRSRTGVSSSLDERYRADMAMSYGSAQFALHAGLLTWTPKESMDET
jgi:hypothetical protein